ncbi:MAG: hypothetical protein ABW250_09895 [Pyrinomonadaceae bacterium]
MVCTFSPEERAKEFGSGRIVTPPSFTEVIWLLLNKRSLKETATTTAAFAPPLMVCFQLISLVLCLAFEAVALSNVIAADAEETAVSRSKRRSAP